MRREHAQDEELTAFLLGAPMKRRNWLETHVGACAGCAKKLAREAALETKLHELAALGSWRRPRGRRPAGDGSHRSRRRHRWSRATVGR